MRQFILATGFETEATGASGTLAIKEIAEGSNVGLNLVLQRTAAEGGDILYPIYPKDFTYNVAKADGGNNFQAKFTVPAVEKNLEYSVIFVKKGKQFNERSNWSFDVRSKDSDDATSIAKQIVTFVKNNPSLGLTATNTAGEVTVDAVKAGESFAIILGGELFGQEATITKDKEGSPAFMDAAMIKDLAAKCAADMGYNYTEDDELYPNFPLNVPAGNYDLFTIRFTEPRLMGTREEAVYQIIQVALPTGENTEFKTALNEFVVDVR